MSHRGSSAQRPHHTPTFAKRKKSINDSKDHAYICIIRTIKALFLKSISCNSAMRILFSPKIFKIYIGLKSIVLSEKPLISKTLLCVFLPGWQALQSLCRSPGEAKCAPTASSFGRSSPPTSASDLSSSSPSACFQRRSVEHNTHL